MNTKDHFARNDCSSKRKLFALNYSRHLCVSTRSSTLLRNRTSRLVSEAKTTPLGKTGDGPHDDFKKKHATLDKQLSVTGRMQRRRVYNMDKAFHRKLVQKNEMLENHALTSVNRIAGSGNSVHCGINEETKSFCDSVSSIAFSNFIEENKETVKNMPGDHLELSYTIAKFDAIEKWLQNLPTPVLKPGAEKVVDP